MEPWVEALIKIYELTAYLDIALLAALVTIYAIIVSFLNKMLRIVKEKREKIQIYRQKENPIKTGSTDSFLAQSTAVRELTIKEKRLEKLEKRFSPSWILLTGVLMLCSFVLILGAIFIESGFFEKWGYSLIPASLGWIFFLVALLRVLLTLKEVEQLAKEPIPEKKQVEIPSEAEESLDDSLVTLDTLDTEISFREVGLFLSQEHGPPTIVLKLKKGKQEKVDIVIKNENPIRSASLKIVYPTHFGIQLPSGWRTEKVVSKTDWDVGLKEIPGPILGGGFVTGPIVFRPEKDGIYQFSIYFDTSANKGYGSNFWVEVEE